MQKRLKKPNKKRANKKAHKKVEKKNNNNKKQKQTKKTYKNTSKAKQNKTQVKKVKKNSFPIETISPNYFSHIVYLFIHKNFFSTNHLRY